MSPCFNLNHGTIATNGRRHGKSMGAFEFEPLSLFREVARARGHTLLPSKLTCESQQTIGMCESRFSTLWLHLTRKLNHSRISIRWLIRLRISNFQFPIFNFQFPISQCVPLLFEFPKRICARVKFFTIGSTNQLIYVTDTAYFLFSVLQLSKISIEYFKSIRMKRTFITIRT